MKRICVVGLGYIGLPTASIFASKGHSVLGVDTNASVVDTINRGEIHIEEPGLGAMVKAAITAGTLRASTVPDHAEVFILSVPTPITADKRADMSFVAAATRSIVPFLMEGSLVILESTSPPRTTLDLVVPILAESGFEIGVDVHVAHSPERVLPGRIIQELTENSRIIGGINPTSAEQAQELFSNFVTGDIVLTDATTAEMVKLMENTYRDVNIALANELAVLCGKLDVSAWDVIKMANLHPRVNLHAPGPGVGGHCISVDPWFLVEQHPEDTPLIRTARFTNDQAPHRVTALVTDLVAGIPNPRVTVLGVTYKGNIDDIRESPALTIISSLTRNGISVNILDPHVKTFKHELMTQETAFTGTDCIVLLADHREFKALDPHRILPQVRTAQVVDTRQHLNLEAWREAGFEAHLLGQVPLPGLSLSRKVAQSLFPAAVTSEAP